MLRKLKVNRCWLSSNVICNPHTGCHTIGKPQLFVLGGRSCCIENCGGRNTFWAAQLWILDIQSFHWELAQISSSELFKGREGHTTTLVRLCCERCFVETDPSMKSLSHSGIPSTIIGKNQMSLECQFGSPCQTLCWYLMQANGYLYIFGGHSDEGLANHNLLRLNLQPSDGIYALSVVPMVGKAPEPRFVVT